MYCSKCSLRNPIQSPIFWNAIFNNIQMLCLGVLWVIAVLIEFISIDVLWHISRCNLFTPRWRKTCKPSTAITVSCYQFVTERDVKRNIDSIFIYHMYQFSDRQRPIAKLRRGIQEIKSWIVQAFSLGEKFIYVELSSSSIQLWNVCRKPVLQV